MNAQKPGIEWTHVYGPGTGYTWNVIQGCRHACEWKMPDGTIAECYAKTIAGNFRSDSFMPMGFEQHYFHPDRLDEPLKLQKPAGIFLDSFSDLMGYWVPDEQIEAVLEACRQAPQHTFQLLTKNAPRLMQFQFKFPPNVWVGVSMPPTFMFGKRLSEQSQKAYTQKALTVLREIDVPVRWMSFEPLSFNVSGIVAMYPNAIQWAVIGAASRGRELFQPDPLWVRMLHNALDHQGVAVFHKGNLEWQPHREEFPGEIAEPMPPAEQMSLF